jgi:hypothetical protein
VSSTFGLKVNSWRVDGKGAALITFNWSNGMLEAQLEQLGMPENNTSSKNSSKALKRWVGEEN